MRDFFKLKMWVLTFGMMILAISFSVVLVYSEYIVKEFSIVTDENIPDNVEYAMAATTDNVSGWAWSENIGWISFNCANYDTCQGGTDDGLACTGSNCGDGACINTCDNFSDYGVNIDPSTGGFSGYAWSDNVGWISFNRKTCSGGADDGDYCEQNSDCANNDCKLDGPGATGNPPQGPFAGTIGAIAKFFHGTKDVRGWAKILSLGNDGWIRFDHGQQPGEVYIDKDGDFHGWAWSDMVVGWISFNSSDPNAGGGPYKVSLSIPNQPPIADANGPYTVFENDTILLDGTGSYDPDGSIVSYIWSGECASYLDDKNIAEAFKSPVFQLLLGRSGDLAKVVNVSEVEVVESNKAFLNGTVVPFIEYKSMGEIYAMPKYFDYRNVIREPREAQPFLINDGLGSFIYRPKDTKEEFDLDNWKFKKIENEIATKAYFDTELSTPILLRKLC